MLANYRYRGQVASAMRGKRGQKLLRDMVQALDAMKTKELHANVIDDGCRVCALGAVGRARSVDLSDIDPETYCADDIAPLLDVAHQLAAEVMFLNDIDPSENPAQRWLRLRSWAQDNLRREPPCDEGACLSPDEPE